MPSVGFQFNTCNSSFLFLHSSVPIMVYWTIVPLLLLLICFFNLLCKIIQPFKSVNKFYELQLQSQR